LPAGAVVKLAPGSSFLSFNTAAVGGPGCEVMAEAITADAGTSEPRDLGAIVRLPKIEAFEVGDRKASENGSEETLQIAVPWPAPSPHAPLYVWLRGEAAGRLTKSLL
jgi:hypothetical protein